MCFTFILQQMLCDTRSFYPPFFHCIFTILSERCSSILHAALVKLCYAFIRHKCVTPSVEYLKELGITVYAILQFPGHYVCIKPRVAHMVFNLGDSVAEATNFCLEGHSELLKDHYVLGKLVYKFLVCYCEEGKETGVPRLRKISFTRLSKMKYNDRKDKKTRGKLKLPFFMKKRMNFFHRKVSERSNLNFLEKFSLFLILNLFDIPYSLV